MQLLCQGGYRNETLTSAVSVLNTEQMKWLQPNVKDGAISPAARVGHAVVCIRERIYMFGGLTEQGLTNETWVRSHNETPRIRHLHIETVPTMERFLLLEQSAARPSASANESTRHLLQDERCGSN